MLAAVQARRAAEQRDRGGVEAGDAAVQRGGDDRRADRLEQLAPLCLAQGERSGARPSSTSSIAAPPAIPSSTFGLPFIYLWCGQLH